MLGKATRAIIPWLITTPLIALSPAIIDGCSAQDVAVIESVEQGSSLLIDTTGAVMINPQPEPPGSWLSINPQPEPPGLQR
ncbi:MAG: hypothetical protein JXQ73_05090 [Phycisphaerae bacterium]|nr:hypothetical protein [Phycisphaerae bacterium]